MPFLHRRQAAWVKRSDAYLCARSEPFDKDGSIGVGRQTHNGIHTVGFFTISLAKVAGTPASPNPAKRSLRS